MEAPGIESPATCPPNVVKRRVKDVKVTTEGDAGPREVSASAAGPDGALRLAIRVAVDAGDLDRARALLEVLGKKAKCAPVVELKLREKKPG